MQRRRVHSRIGRRWRIMQLFARFVAHMREQARLRYVRDVYEGFETSLVVHGLTWREAIRNEVRIVARNEGYHFTSDDLRMYMTTTRLRLALQRFVRGLQLMVEHARRRVRRRLV